MTTPLQTVLITGCSSGIGKASAQLLAEQGFRVYAGVRSHEDVEKLRDAMTPNLEPVQLDVSEHKNVSSIIQQIKTSTPEGLFAVINNAGVGLPAAVELSTAEEMRKLFEINTIAPLQIIQACLPLLRLGQGRVINISSMNGTMSLPMVGGYSASKFALEALSDALRVELRPWKIPVSIIRPGQIRTAIFDKARSALEKHRSEIPEALKPGYEKMYAKAAKFNERGAKSRTSPEHVAQVVLKVLLAKHPRPRYHVGFDAHAMRIMNTLVPQRIIDRLLARTMGVFKPLE